MSELYQIEAERLAGGAEKLSAYKGQVVLVVNVASKCGFTPQYEGLEALYRQYKEDGFAVLGFPSNQFGEQEPGDAEEIANFCSLTYDVTFPMFEKVDVNGADAHPLYKWLKSEKPGLAGTKNIKWNFTKFLVDRDGKVVQRFGPQDTPAVIERHIKKLL